MLTNSDLGVTGLAHHGSTARGGTGSYSFQLTNAGDFASDVTYSVILSAGTSVPALPGGCTLTSASALGTRVDCVIGTMGAPVDRRTHRGQCHVRHHASRPCPGVQPMGLRD